jgi:hypothetical protein
MQGCEETRLYNQEHLKQWPILSARTTGGGYIYNDTRVLSGIILTKTGDTLKGKMKILPYFNGGFSQIPLLPNGKYTAKDIVGIPRTRIKFLRAYGDSSWSGQDYMDFVNLHDRDLWRILVIKDSFAIYDDYTPGIDPVFGTEMILVKQNMPWPWIRIYHHVVHDDARDIDPYILAFINKRYKSHFQGRDFKDERAMFDYILDKENSRPIFPQAPRTPPPATNGPS